MGPLERHPPNGHPPLDRPTYGAASLRPGGPRSPVFGRQVEELLEAVALRDRKWDSLAQARAGHDMKSFREHLIKYSHPLASVKANWSMRDLEWGVWV